MTQAYAVSILVLGRPVMCDTIAAPSAADARAIWERKFWASPDELRADLAGMDETNRHYAERMLVLMDETRKQAKAFGLTVTARASRAKARAVR